MRRGVVLIMMLLLGIAAGAGGVFFLRGGRDSGFQDTARWTYRCPMHPTMVSDKPADCPICYMRMVPVEGEPGGRADAAAAPASLATPTAPAAPATPRRRILYQSTMNPSETAQSPGKDSMGMEMVAVEIEEPVAGAEPVVGGRSTINLDDRRRQLIGVRTVRVEERPLVRTINAVGVIAYDETRLHQVTSKVGGWVETLQANATGEPIRKGEPLLTIYSPELLATSQEYLLAIRARDRLAGSDMASVRDDSEALVRSARRRLDLFDLSSRQIANLETTGEAPRVMTLYAPITGTIITRKVTQGEKIEPGAPLLELADLKRVWVLAEVYEYELAFVKVGQKAVMTLPYLPGRTLEGRVELVYPVLSEATRTVKLRMAFPNPDLSLRPEMYANVRIESGQGAGIVIPDSALIHSGARSIVFVDLGDGNLEPREIKLGVRLDQSVEVLEGLAAGENVVVSGNFLIDSESQLKAALRASAPGKDAGTVGKAAPGHVH